MKKSKILLIDHNAELSAQVADHFHSAGFQVTSFAQGPAAIDHAKEQGLPHIALVSLSQSPSPGFELANQLKSIADVPIIFLTETGAKADLLDGLKRYAEDFIVKPLNLQELETRVQLVLARMPSFDYASEPMVRVDDNLSIDFAHNRVEVGGKSVGLTPTESAMLHVLLRNATRVVENRVLIARVWPSEEVFEDTLRVHMHRLRRKIEADSHHPHYIRTERGVGYRFTQRPPEQRDDQDD